MSARPAPRLGLMAERVRTGAVPPDHYVEDALRRIRADREEKRPLRAFLSILSDGVPSATGPRPPPGASHPSPSGRTLEGVPVAVKDNIATADLPTTCASRILEGYVSPFEATAVRRLRDAGAVIVGKTNMDEFAMGSSTENSAFGPTRNPFGRTRVPGGSSGGSAAAVAAGWVPAALGSDTGGSVRQPAAFCGVVGIKPTFGRVSRYGLVAFASDLDQIGAFAGSVADAALLLQVVAGHDPRDATSADRPVPDLGAAAGRGGALEGIRGLTVGLPREYLAGDVKPEIRRYLSGALEALKGLGARTREVSLPHTRYALPAYYVLAPAQASSNLARYDGARYGRRAQGATTFREMVEASRGEGFGPEVRRRILLGTHALSAGYDEALYGRARAVRRRVARDFDEVFTSGVDAILAPTTPGLPFRLGERGKEPYRMYRSDIFTVPANLAGIPALSVPLGRVDGLPVAGQVMAARWREETAVRVGAALEAVMAPRRASARHPDPADPPPGPTRPGEPPPSGDRS